MGKLLIVSNRLPVTIRLDRGDIAIMKSTGGLATGLRGPHEQLDSTWIGWPGDVSRFDSSERARIESELSKLCTIPLYLTQSEINRYYEGFSNGVLWPLFHYLTDKVQRDAWQNWKTYHDVNRRFAELVVKHYRPGDIVWVHDYQLALVPGMLREMIPDAQVGFFLHIPFPSSEVFRILPWREEILRGILGSDLIGFHTHSYLRHFSRAALHVLGIEADGESIEVAGRLVRLGAFPMGVDAGRFTDLAADAEVMAEARAIKEKCGNQRLLLGVDRLDHTKGLARRMLALERLFERRPSLRNKVKLVQVVAPSRTKVLSYAELRKQLDEIVGRINGAYSTVSSVPIHYLYQSLSERQLVPLYLAADIMLVTPLRDGMNLVAKEYVASQVDGDGVLILSEFAGASAEMAEAIHVNPYDLDRVASAIEEALVMPEGERRARMSALRRRVQQYDAYYWADSFIESLKSARRDNTVFLHSVSTAAEMEALTRKLHRAERLLLLLDYDGTLVPFASTPELAAPDNELKEMLRSLANRHGTYVHLLSGRSRDTLERWFGDLPISLHAEHGFWSRHASGNSWQPYFEGPVGWKDRLLSILKGFTTRTPGSLLEEKTAGFAWHYRMADPEFGAVQAGRLKRSLEREVADLPAEVLSGSKVIEVRHRGVNKGMLASKILTATRQPLEVLAMGDDRTDEDLFAALPETALTVHVGPQPSRAQYRINDPAAGRLLLKELLASDSRALSSERGRATSL